MAILNFKDLNIFNKNLGITKSLYLVLDSARTDRITIFPVDFKKHVIIDKKI